MALIPLTEAETRAQAHEWQRLLDQGLDQGMCRACAVETACATQHGLTRLSSLALCKGCERRLNPPTTKNRRTGKYELTRAVSRGSVPGSKVSRRACATCAGSLAGRRADALFCGPTCRKAGSRASRVTDSPRNVRKRAGQRGAQDAVFV